MNKHLPLAGNGRRFTLSVCGTLFSLLVNVSAIGQESQIADRVVESQLDVDTISKPERWDRFRIFVWQYKTDARQDIQLYRQLGLSAFHIDRGAGTQTTVDWAAQNQLPYYVDHAAGKGILHLTERTGLKSLRNDGSLQPRPQSLAEEKTIRDLYQQLESNLKVAAKGPALAIALDDEVSLGNFNTPLEVDASESSVALFRKWLEKQYGDITQLNDQWDTNYGSFADVRPVGFEEVRQRITGKPFSAWNLSPWIDWRSYMDTQFSAVTAELVQYANSLAPGIPIGVVGGQQPSPYGGFDYEKLGRAVQWIEAYDIGGTNELLTSFWHHSKKPAVQTFFASGDLWRDQWFLWYYWAHGNSGVIAWPDMSGNAWFENGKVRPEIEQLASTFNEVQSQQLAFTSRENVKRVCDPIAILYSHPSVQVSWATDALTHGKTWPRRSSSLDNDCSSAGQNRIAWNKLLEDCGFQPRWISVDELEAGRLSKEEFKVLVLPRAMALSDASCEAVERFRDQGGCVVADYWSAVFDQHGRARRVDGKLQGGLDELFNVKRDEAAGYFDGQTLTEVDGEKYNLPFLERLPRYKKSTDGLNIVELGSEAGMQLRAVYLNLSPLAYSDPSYRLSDEGAKWRSAITNLFASWGIKPEVSITANGQPLPMIETIRWKGKDKEWLICVANPTREAAIDGAGTMQASGYNGPIQLLFSSTHSGGSNLRSGEVFQAGNSLTTQFAAPEPIILEFSKP